MKKLHLFQPTVADHLASPEHTEEITLNSSALRFFTDFKNVKPLSISASMHAIDAQQAIEHTQEKMRFVVDSDDSFLGIISIDELSDREIIRKASEGYSRHEILVSDLMITRAQLSAFDLSEVHKASIEDVVKTLKDSGRHHCLVLDRESHSIRGIFSASDISRKLHLPINIYDQSSFYKVFAAAVQ